MNNFEAKAYKKLYELQNQTLNRILNRVRNALEYHKDKPEQILEELEAISNYSKWDYYGIESKQDTAVLDALQNCLKPSDE